MPSCAPWRSACRSTVRSTDLLGRFGGEEFVAVLPVTTLAEAAVCGERLRAGVQSLAALPETQSPVTVSIGLAELAAGESVEQWLARADAALYQAKHAGRNRVAGGPAAAPLSLAADADLRCEPASRPCLPLASAG